MARRSAAEMCAAISASSGTFDVGQAVRRRSLQRADQGAMHDEVGIAADRRGEMRVAAQVESEVAVVLGRVFGLRLRAQHDLVDQLLVLAALHPRQDAVEMRRPHAWPLAS